MAEPVRNPLRREQDAFRLLIIFFVAALAVIAVALVAGSTAALVLAAILAVIGCWRAWGMFRAWGRYGSDPDRGDDGAAP